MASSPKTKLWFAVCKGDKTVYGATEDLWAQPRCQCSGKRRQQRHFCRGCCTSSVCVCTHVCVHARVCMGARLGAPGWDMALAAGVPGCTPPRAQPPAERGQPPRSTRALWLQLYGPLLELSSGRSGCQAHLSVGDPLFLPPVLLSSQDHWCIFPSPFHTSPGSKYTLFAPFWHLPCSLPHSLPPIPSTEVS